jgi:hypothetical protein
MLLGVAAQLTQEGIPHKDGRPAPAHHEQALLTLATCEQVDGWYSSCRPGCVSKQCVKGDRETALSHLWVVLEYCGNELIESPYPSLSLLPKAQCGLNLSNAQQPKLNALGPIKTGSDKGKTC